MILMPECQLVRLSHVPSSQVVLLVRMPWLFHLDQHQREKWDLSSCSEVSCEGLLYRVWSCSRKNKFVSVKMEDQGSVVRRQGDSMDRYVNFASKLCLKCFCCSLTCHSHSEFSKGLWVMRHRNFKLPVANALKDYG